MITILAAVTLVLDIVIIILILARGANREGRVLRQQFTSLETKLEVLQRTFQEELSRHREEGARTAMMGREEAQRAQKIQTDTLLQFMDTLSRQLHSLTQMNEQKLTEMRETVERRLTSLQEDNSKKLEQMRVTVDEKLHQTLETRLGESFKLVSERLELVQRGLGEMKSLAAGVGDLKRVLSNVKARGTLGEVQLDNILAQTLSAEQYQKSATVKAGSAERVDFAVILPGKDDDNSRVLLPIDAKFPLEDYQRLLDAQEAGDATTAAEAAKLLEARIKQEAKSINEKYIDPPNTTDFAIMFLPIEGLFAEVLRRSGLWETLQREYRVIITGPTTITALLNSLQMGFRTLAIERRSSEVWRLLGAVKTEFGKFGEVLDKTQKKLQEASHTIEAATTRTRVIERRLRTVQEISGEEAVQLLADEL